MIAFFSFAISMAAGRIWGIIEYMLDSLFGFELQKPHPDTMIDLIFVFIGWLLISAGGYLYAKKEVVRQVLERIRLAQGQRRPPLSQRSQVYLLYYQKRREGCGGDGS